MHNFLNRKFLVSVGFSSPISHALVFFVITRMIARSDMVSLVDIAERVDLIDGGKFSSFQYSTLL